MIVPPGRTVCVRPSSVESAHEVGVRAMQANNHPQENDPPKAEFLSAKDVCRRLKISRTTLWRLQQEDSSFPAALVVSRRSVRFSWPAVQRWVQARPRRGAAR